METVPLRPPPVNDGGAPPWAVGWVYLIDSAAGYQKIGFSTEPRRRVKEVTKLPFACWLAHEFPVGTRNVETRLHEYYQPLRVRGEWFALGGEAAVVMTIREARTTADLPIPTGRWRAANG